MPEGLRVLHVSHSAIPGGSNEVLLSLLRHRPAGSSCDCVFLEPGPVAESAAAAGARVAVVDAGRAREAWRAPGVIRGLRGAIRATSADVVLAHVTKAHLYAAPAAALEGVPYLWWQQERRTQKPFMHEVAGRIPAAAVICSADWTAAEQRARWPRVPVERVHLGTETGALGPPRVHEAGLDGEPVIGVVARLQRWKRIELALRALVAIRAQAPGVRMVVLGGDADPGYGDELRAEADRLGIADAVHWAGHVPDAAAAMTGFDVLLHTSEDEPFGLVLVEALLRGVPVVAPPGAGPGEIVRDGVDGVLTEDYSAAVLGLLADPARRTAMGAAGREHALQCFTAATMAERAWEICERVAKSAPTRGGSSTLA